MHGEILGNLKMRGEKVCQTEFLIYLSKGRGVIDDVLRSNLVHGSKQINLKTGVCVGIYESM